MFFKLILEAGHVGAGKSYDMVRYFRGKDVISVMDSALRTPRVKKKEGGQGIKLIQPISEREYVLGKTSEAEDPYLNRRRS
ncbi:MAG: hypothetical protein JRH07_04630 [Deltaproteobacteria bacterium]|nr:hypothetical protein [Deltaproteobacteria bacterium]MBW2121116.1 hypothetical protein [Deltaproteobacteria bacterium]